MISHIDIIGALVYRTREALNRHKETEGNSLFYANAVKNYKYHNIVFHEPNKMHLWHFPGTHQEISEFFNTVSTSTNAPNKLFPCLLNYQSVVEDWGMNKDGLVQITLDLALGCVVDLQWTTEQRNRTVHKYILEPIFEEFIKQIKHSGWFQIDMQGIKMKRMKVFTTGASMNQAIKTNYGWYFDTIQMSNFSLLLNPVECEKERELIEKESELVTDNLINNGRSDIR